MSPPRSPELVRFGAFELDLRSRELRKDGSSTGLPEQSIKVLEMLLEQPGELILRDDIRSRLWPNDTVVEFDHSINTAIHKLRLALGDSADAPRYIETLARRGYRFIAALEKQDPARPPVVPQSKTRQTRFAPLRRSRTAVGAISAVLAAALAYFAIDKLWISKQLPIRSRQILAAEEATAFNPPPQSIAVLPLANESGEAAQQYFSDGIAEDLITALSQFPGVKVIGRTSAFRFRDSKEDSRSIGVKLGVAHLLEGSVRREGGVVRISAELIDTSDGSTQWSERYDRPYKDLFALQDEITRAVVGALRAKLLPGEHAVAQSDRPPSGSLEAYNALLEGRFYYFRTTEADYRKAIEHYTQATRLDPRYALAWSRLSEGWTDLASNYLAGAPAQEAHAKARTAADRALAVSPDLAAAHIARGDIFYADLDWRAAEAEYRRAMALSPNDTEAKLHVGQPLATFGELEPAIELTRQALSADPLHAYGYAWLTDYLLGLNRLAEAEKAVRKAIELQPAAGFRYLRLTMIEVRRGHAQAALAAAQQEPPGAWHDVALALARQVGGDRNAADATLRTLIEKDASVAAYGIAEVYALRDDAKGTFEWLDRAWSNRDANIGILLYDPFLMRYKDDPRFAAFCQRVGLLEP